MQSSVDHETIEAVQAYYAMHGRHDLPWRELSSSGGIDPYHVLVSELMLQQTQVSRVLPKYKAFLAVFPRPMALAATPLSAVLAQWQGLGYNRRAKYLWLAAQQITELYDGVMPRDMQGLRALPGVGASTAGAVLAYAYDQPAAFLETNVRTVLIHHYYPAAVDLVPDAMLQGIAERLIAQTDLSPREWNWALMDYGTYLKQTAGNLNKLSKAYQKQSRFEGSRRQVRGQILRSLTAAPLTLNKLRIICNDERFESVLADLISEQLVHLRGDQALLGGQEPI